MKLDIRNMSNETSLFKLWFNDSFRKLRLVYSKEQIDDAKLKDYLINEWRKRENPQGRFFNNVTKDNKLMTVEEFINMFLNNKESILTGYACLYKSQETQKSMSIEGIKELLALRKVKKKEMLKYVEGTYWYIKYNVDQLAYKRSANSQYGVSGQSSSVFYNSYIQNSITLTGRDLITTSISTMESFLTNTNKFNNINELYEFINNIKYEKANHSILMYVDRPISVDELVDYLITRLSCQYDIRIIKTIVNNMNEELRTRIYYKNQLVKLLSNTWFVNKIKEFNESKIFEELTENGDPHSEPEFRQIVCEFALYNHILYDRYNRAMHQNRDTVLVVDTDSNFLYLDRQIKAINKMIGDESDDAEFRTLNLLIDIATQSMIDIFATATGNLGVKEKYRPIINMKNEFKYKRLMTTSNKKSYSGMFDAKLGKRLPKPKLDMKGLQISKSNSPKMLRDRFQSLLINKVLLPKKVSPIEILDEFNTISNDIDRSLSNGDVTYATPQNVAAIENYKVPEQQLGVRAVLIWNALEPNNTINIPDRCRVFELDCTSDADPRLLQLKETHPDKYKAIISTIFKSDGTNGTLNLRKYGFTKVAVPMGTTKLPEYLIPFIDKKTMIAKNVQNANIILKSLGIMCFDNKTSKTETRSTLCLL